VELIFAEAFKVGHGWQSLSLPRIEWIQLQQYEYRNTWCVCKSKEHKRSPEALTLFFFKCPGLAYRNNFSEREGSERKKVKGRILFVLLESDPEVMPVHISRIFCHNLTIDWTDCGRIENGALC
jgi:hypothetical protein